MLLLIRHIQTLFLKCFSEGHSRDPRHKEKFIIHLTGPLSFDPKCRKQFHRLYYNTRDCTVPASPCLSWTQPVCAHKNVCVRAPKCV
uniref:ALK and LTK ligand 1 n=1 Tax=Stegastes partitus TaxID=144197 RepID=A0A3B4ZHV8_9TELE